MTIRYYSQNDKISHRLKRFPQISLIAFTKSVLIRELKISEAKSVAKKDLARIEGQIQL